MNLAPTPLEVADFSGGMTENILQSDPRRYQFADNFFITVDKKLDERFGFVAFGVEDPGTTKWLPSGSKRVNGMFPFLNETLLLAQYSRSIYVIDPVPLTGVSWTNVIGPSSNEALSDGDAYAQLSIGEFNRHVYMTTDTPIGTLPSKIYRDDTNAWKAITAGLPRVYAQPNYTTGTLLSSCIALANALRSAVLAHVNDYYAIYGNALQYYQGALHPSWDKYAAACFVAVPAWNLFLDNAYPGPPIAPAPAATDETSLYTLIYALYLAYTYHSSERVFVHYVFNYSLPGGFQRAFPYGPKPALFYNTKPSDIPTAAAQLDDFFQKWNWHRGNIWTHEPGNDPAYLSRWPIAGAKIGNIFTSKTTPYLTPDYTDLFKFVNNLKYMYNQHVIGVATTSVGTGAHLQQSINKDDLTFGTNYFAPIFTCAQPDCTDLDSMYLMIWSLRCNYQNNHWMDAYNSAIQKNQITWTGTAGSPNITAVTDKATGSALTLTTNSFIFSFSNLFTDPLGTSPGGRIWARVVTSGSGTATLDKNVTANQTSVASQWTLALYHFFSLYAGNTNTVITAPTSTQLADYSATAYSGGYSYGVDIGTWLALASEFYTALYAHGNDATVHYPSSFINLVFPNQPFFVPSISTVSYAFTYSHQYTVEPNGVIYLVQSNPTFSGSQFVGKTYDVLQNIPSVYPKLYSDVSASSSRANVLTGIPVLTNDAKTNYDTSNVKVNIYRTTDGGNTYYLLAQVANGTTTYTDQTPDIRLVKAVAPPNAVISPLLYTAGGTVGYDQPPQCRFMHIVNNTAYYGGILDSGQFFPNRIRQANQGSPDASPATFTDDLDDEITGITSTRNNIVVGCTNSIYRLAGGFNYLGQGSLVHERISDTLGMLNARSIVKTEVGVFFAGNDGFYYTDGFQLIKISLELDKTYAAFTATAAQRRRIVGAYDKVTRRVVWSVADNLTDPENTKFFVFYLDYGIKPSGVFTTLSNGAAFKPTSLAFARGQMYLGDYTGVIMKMSANQKTDMVPNASTLPATWTTLSVPYNYTSCAIDNGSTFQRKWTTKIHVVGQNHGNVAMQPESIRDLNQTGNGLAYITPVNYMANPRWGAPTVIWGTASYAWRYDGKFDLWRRIPGGHLRADFRQFVFVPAKVAIYSSSSGEYPLGANVNVNGPADTAALLTPLGYTLCTWPLDVVGYVISFQQDNYTREYPILSLNANATIITFSDPLNTSITNPSEGWVIRGTKKEQRLSLSSYVVHYGYLGDKNENYPGKYTTSGSGNLGENPS